MIAYVRMQLLRWRRRTLGIGLFAAAVLLPTLACGVWVVGKRMTSLPLPVLALFVVLPAGALSIVNQLAGLVQEEARRRRTALLRVGSLDGWRAIGAFELLGLSQAALLGAAGYVGPLLVGLFVGVRVWTWGPYVVLTVVVLTAFAPVAVIVGFLLPRAVALLLLNGLAFVGSLILGASVVVWVEKASLGLPLAGLGIHVVCLTAGGWLWRHRSADLW